MDKFYAILLDEFIRKMYLPVFNDDSLSGYHIVFKAGSKEEAVEKITNELKKVVEKIVYQSDSYGRCENE